MDFNNICNITNDFLTHYKNIDYCIFDSKTQKFVIKNGKLLTLNYSIEKENNKITIQIIDKENKVKKKIEITINEQNTNWKIYFYGDEIKEFDEYKYKINKDILEKIFIEYLFYDMFDNLFICPFNLSGLVCGRLGNNLFSYVWLLLIHLQITNNEKDMLIFSKYTKKNRPEKRFIKVFDIFENINYDLDRIYMNINENDENYKLIRKINNLNSYISNPQYELFNKKFCLSDLYTREIIHCELKEDNNIIITNFIESLIDKDNFDKINKKKKFFENDISLHFRGSDFCITHENNYNSKLFLTLHFKYYYDCLVNIIENSEKTNFTINIFCHSHDEYIVYIMKIYLKQSLKKKFNDVNLDFRTETLFFNKFFSGRNDKLKNLMELELIYIMACHKYLILSNSSLSFWSGFISKNKTLYYVYNDPDHIKYDWMKPKYYINFYPIFYYLEEITINKKCINIVKDKTDKEIKEYIFPCYIKYTQEKIYKKKCNDNGSISYHTFFIMLCLVYIGNKIEKDKVKEVIENIHVNTLKTDFENNENSNSREYLKDICYEIYLNIINTIKDKQINTDSDFIKILRELYFKPDTNSKNNYLVILINSLHYSNNFELSIKNICEYIIKVKYIT